MGKKILPATSERVKLSTNDKINEKITDESLSDAKQYINADKDEISRRIEELEQEWDTERVIETNSAGLVILGAVLGLTVNKKWLFLSLAEGLFLLQHALQGWCPLIPVLRRLGIRTEAEINAEKTLLKFIRGDYRRLCKPSDVYPYRLKKDLLK